MATEADLIQKFKDLDIPVGADFEELIHAAFASSNLADLVNSKADDSKVVHTTDMRKPANQVASIDEVNTKQDKIGYTPADDSKVVHNSGNEEIAGQKTFDTAPIDKTTGNPYITKDGVPAVPSTLADTTKDANFTGKLQKSGIDVATKSDITTAVSTATANMVDSSKPTNFTAGLKSGGVNVATAADLKSLADKAWHEVNLPDTSVLKQAHFMYRSEPIDTHYNTSFILTGKVIVPTSNSSTGVILLDLSSYLPISKADYKNYTVNSTLLGPDDKTFAGSDNSNFNPNFHITAKSINVKLIDSNLVLYSSYGYAYFKTVASADALISVSLSSDSKSLPTIDFVSSTKS